jgi:hypothetical protein
MKYRVILDVSDEHPALSEKMQPLGMDIPYLVRLAFQEWQGIAVESVEPLDQEDEATDRAAEKPSDARPGATLRERRERLGISVHGLSGRSGLDRKTIGRAEDDAPQTRRSTFEVLHRALNEIEADRAAKGTTPPAPSRSPKSNEVEFQVSAEDGFTMTVRGPSSHAHEIGASVVRLMRDLRDE